MEYVVLLGSTCMEKTEQYVLKVQPSLPALPSYLTRWSHFPVQNLGKATSGSSGFTLDTL